MNFCCLRQLVGVTAMLAMLLPVIASAEDVTSLSADFWSSPRSGEKLLQEEAMAEVVRAWNAREQRLLRIRHPLGESGLLAAEELRDWLIALGVSREAIDVRAGDESMRELELSVR